MAIMKKVMSGVRKAAPKKASTSYKPISPLKKKFYDAQRNLAIKTPGAKKYYKDRG